jgi:membrane protease YdiL (CAAX protease family)
MSFLADRIAFYKRAFFPPGARTASVPFVFMSVAIVATFELPAHFISKAGYQMLGLLASEIIAVAFVPLALIALLKLDRKKLLAFDCLQFSVIALLAASMIGADIVIDYLTAASELILPLPEDMRESLTKIMAASTAQIIVWKFFVLCIVPAVCEEIFFRGFFQTSLTARLGAAKAILITAVVFAIMHGNFYYVHLYMLLGLIFGWVYAVTGSLWAPIICHIVNNSWTYFNNIWGFKLPLIDAPIYVNAVIVAGGAILFIATLKTIHSKSRAL